ncbi:hypothetical protein J6590_062710 [Homalodisca vitripennis]|nr:hypothetical protein J6590_062710 [Homalodisca vitripennis]
MIPTFVQPLTILIHGLQILSQQRITVIAAIIYYYNDKAVVPSRVAIKSQFSQQQCGWGGDGGGGPGVKLMAVESDSTVKFITNNPSLPQP